MYILAYMYYSRKCDTICIAFHPQFSVGIALFNYAFEHIKACFAKVGDGVVMYFCLRGIDFTSLNEFAIGFWNCSDSLVFLFFIQVCSVLRTVVCKVYPFSVSHCIVYFSSISSIYRCSLRTQCLQHFVVIKVSINVYTK